MVIIEYIGVKASIAIGVVLVIFFFVMFRYQANLDELKRKKRSEWLDISDMQNEIPQGKYNIELKNGHIIWNVTEREFKEHLHEVVQWMAK